MSSADAPMRLNHAVLFVPDIDSAEAFYTTVFKMSVVDRSNLGGAVFLRFEGSSNHHDLGLFRSRVSSIPTPGSPGLYHLAWQVDTLEILAGLKETLVSLGSFTGESSHGATKSVYGVDPAGNEFEVMWMLPRDHWGEYDHLAVVEPLDWHEELAQWGGTATGRESSMGIPG